MGWGAEKDRKRGSAGLNDPSKLPESNYLGSHSTFHSAWTNPICLYRFCLRTLEYHWLFIKLINIYLKILFSLQNFVSLLCTWLSSWMCCGFSFYQFSKKLSVKCMHYKGSITVKSWGQLCPPIFRRTGHPPSAFINIPLFPLPRRK